MVRYESSCGVGIPARDGVRLHVSGSQAIMLRYVLRSEHPAYLITVLSGICMGKYLGKYMGSWARPARPGTPGISSVEASGSSRAACGSKPCCMWIDVGHSILFSCDDVLVIYEQLINVPA
jgi:hypothetical protein